MRAAMLGRPCAFGTHDMVFSSNIFLFGFLPAVLLIYFLLPHRLRNPFLFLATVFFYFWGAGAIVLVFLACMAVNYIAGRLISTSAESRAQAVLIAAIIFDLSLLLYFKYCNFFVDQVNLVLPMFGREPITVSRVALPIGISFFVFEAISYVVEVYRRDVTPPRRFFDFGTYLGLFPHLIAGPIVRFSDVSDQIRRRDVNVDMFFSGIGRFAQGLAKKAILANGLGSVADKVFSRNAGELSTGVAWLGIICYTFQIYYDFAGYSDMAIGLGKFFGFTFPENFDQPYRSRNITEFWQRWHMTLSFWLRDFVFIPLGANRKGRARTYLNLLIVFFLCGLWHGAAWTFVLWGTYHGLLLVFERALKDRYGFQITGVWGNLWTFLLLIVGWVLFRAGTVAAAVEFLGMLFGFRLHRLIFEYHTLRFYLQPDVALWLFCAVLFAWFPVERLRLERFIEKPMWVGLCAGVFLALILYSAMVLSTAGFNPFIYFRF
jgi:alginate O-acetyltransferase complex protein AlgI